MNFKKCKWTNKENVNKKKNQGTNMERDAKEDMTHQPYMSFFKQYSAPP